MGGRTIAVLALLLVGCQGPSVEPSIDDQRETSAGERSRTQSDQRVEAPEDERPEADPEPRLEVVPGLRVSGDIDDAGGLELRQVWWTAIPADLLAEYEAAFGAVGGQGTATLTGLDGRVLAEGPVEVAEYGDGGRSFSANLLVPDDADEAAKLHLRLDDGAELTVERGPDVQLVRAELPEPGPLARDATVSWEASSGEVDGRWLAGTGALDDPPDPDVHGRSGVTRIGGASLPAEGGWLLLIAYDGLAFDLEVAGPYLHPDGDGSPVEWRVLVEGDDLEDLGTLELHASDSPWLAHVTVWVLPPGGPEIPPDDIDATWTSDRQGDLAEVNLRSAPQLWLRTEELVHGEHVWTLHLRAQLPGGETATHEVQLDVHVTG